MQKAAGIGCIGVLALATLGVISALGDDDPAPTAAPACTTVKTDDFPASKAGITVTTGKTSCEGDDTVLPITVKNGTGQLVTVDLALKLSRGDGSELETVLVQQELPGGKRLEETTDIYPWGKLDSADGPITATVGEFTVTEGPAPEPTEDIDVPDMDVDRPNKCNRKWYC